MEPLRVLVVDDTLVFLEAIEEIFFEIGGYVGVTAESGERALATLAEQACDIILTDLQMPGMNGIQLAQLVHAQLPGKPIVLMSERNLSSEEQAACREAGIGKVMRKPFFKEDLAVAMRQATAQT